MADKRISQLVERTTLANNDVLPIVASGASTTNKVTLQTIEDWMQGNLNFGVTSVAISVPTGLTVTGSPITSTGTFIIGFAAGYSIPTNTKQSEWDSAYNDKINSVSVTGTTTKTITLTQQDGGTLSAQWSDLQPVTSVFGRTGDVVAVEGDYSLDQLSGVGITSPSSGQVLKYDGTNWVNATEQYVGTVTSVGVSVPAAFSVTGSPITTSGTITISGAGTSAQYIDGTGSLQTFPNLIAQATNLVREVYNNSGATMTKGTVVYINGGHGNLPTIAKAKADADSTSAQTYGVVQANISDQSNGYIVVVGDLTNIDTQGYLEGTQLYLSGTTAGNYTSTKPYAPIHIVYVGIVTRSHPTQGIIAIKIQNGYEMDEIHDVDAQNPSDNDILQYKTATGLWTKTAGTTTNIAEGTNLYYTNERARQSISETITGIDYDNTTGVFSTTSGYGIPTTAKQTQWDAAYNDKINSASVSGTTTKTLTLTQQDGGTITTSWSDYDTAPVTSVFGRTGAIVATEGDYNLTQLGDVTITTPSNGQVLKYNGTTWVNDTGYVGTVTSVGLSVPTGLSVSGSPITTSGTLAISLESGYSIPTTASQTNWDAAYNDKINSAAVTGTTTKTLTLTQQDGGTITASWTDINTDAVTSVFGRTGAVVATEGDYTLTQLGDVTITTPTNGQFLKYDGTSWINAAAGTVTSVALATGTTGTDVGVTGSPITGAGTITLNIPVASATNTGKLSSTDWSTFNGKQAALNGTGFVKISGTTISYDNNTYVDTTNAQYINGFKTFYEGISVQPTSSTTTPINFTTSMNSSQSQPVAANFGFAWNANANNQIFTGVYITAANPTNPSGYTGLQTYALRTSGNVKVAGTIEATGNITGANLSGTNTGDQTLAGLGGVPTSRSITINGTAQDLSANRTWSLDLHSVTSQGSSTSNSITCTGVLYMKDSGPSINENRINAGWNSTGDSIDMWINYEGYQNSNSYFRDFRIGDGKRGSAIIHVDGSDRIVNVAGNIDFAQGYVLRVQNPSMYITALTPSYFGYSTSYGVLIVGQTGANNRTLSFGVDVSGNPSGAFSGWGNEYLWRNAASFITPNSSNNGYNTLLSWNSNGQLTLSQNTSVSGLLTANNGIQVNGTYSQTTSSTQPVMIYGDSAGINGLFRIQIDEVNDAYATGARTFLGDGATDIFIGTGNSSYTPANTYIALNHNGEISMGAGSVIGKHFIMLSGGSSEFKRPLIVNGNGAYTNGTPALNIPSASWAIVDASVYRQMQRSIGYVGDYEQHVILLHPIYNGTNLIEWNNCNGKIYSTRGWSYAGRIGDVYEVHTNTAYNSYGGNLIGHSATGKLYTCTYGGRKYLALIPDYRTSATSYHFDGYISNNTGGETLKLVTYRMSNTGTIVNSEIYNSLAAYGENYTWQRGTFFADGLNIQGNASISKGGRTLSLGDGNYANHINVDSNVDFAFNYNNGGTGGLGFFGGTSVAKFMCTYTGTLTVSGDVIAYGTPSDARLKTIKEKVPNALDKVMQLNGYRFDWDKVNEIAQIKEDIGVIAQEVAEVLPELARTNEDGYMSVRYQGLTAVLIEAIKEQQKQIEELKNLVNALAK